MLSNTNLRLLWTHVSPRRKAQLGLLLLLTIVASVVEVFSIGVVVPFLGALMAPEKLLTSPALASTLYLLGITKAEQLPAVLTLLFVAGALLTGAMRIALSWSSIRLAYATGADLSYAIYERTLYQPYSVHVSRNSSQIIVAIVTKVNAVINGVIIPVITLISAALLMTAILSILLVIDTAVTLFSFFGFGLIYLCIIWATKTVELRNSREINAKSTQVVKALQEGLGGIRDVLLDGSQKTYCEVYRHADIPLRRAQGSNQFIAVSPRFAIEAIGVSLIASVALLLSGKPGGVESSIPLLGALAIGAQRMLPLMQQAYAAWSSLIGNSAALSETLILLNQATPPEEGEEQAHLIHFRREIKFCRVGFQYGPDQPMILEGVEIALKKGERVGIVGRTGSGKTTFVDLLMGLLAPVAGHIEIDGVRLDDRNRRSWYKHIAHVPQSVFLTDNSIAENIAFGTPRDKIDLNRVRRAAAQAQIDADIDTWPLGYDTTVGERGVRLSGGQCQRIGIARALYKKVEVIIFDEATSALDGETEDAVMAAIERLSSELTVIVIAHRLSTLRNCSKIIEVIKGGVPRICNYDEISEQSC